jgi:competence protein ComEC
MSKDAIQTGGEAYFGTYRYTSKPLVKAYDSCEKKRKIAANLFMGEWVKILDEKIPTRGFAHVHYRGGDGYIDIENAGVNRCLEILFIDVGQGDSILIQTPDDRRVLIDGGFTNAAHEVITNKYRLDKEDNYIDFDAVIASHSDSDHTKGLIPILNDPKIAVRRFYHNGLFPRESLKDHAPGQIKNKRMYGLVDCPSPDDEPALTKDMVSFVNAIKAAETNLPIAIQKMRKIGIWRGRFERATEFVCKRLDASSPCLPPFDNEESLFYIKVLWPSAERTGQDPTYPYYSSVSKTVNGNSIVLLVNYGNHRILLSGDLNAKSMKDVIKLHPSDPDHLPLRAHVYKAAHHGSQDFSLDFLEAVKPDAAVISSGDEANDKHGHPRAVLLGTITRYSVAKKPAVFSTELAACYSPLTKKEMEDFREYKGQLYARSLQGIVNLRSNGKELYLATVYGREAPDKPFANVNWKYDIWPSKR